MDRRKNRCKSVRAVAQDRYLIAGVQRGAGNELLDRQVARESSRIGACAVRRLSSALVSRCDSGPRAPVTAIGVPAAAAGSGMVGTCAQPARVATRGARLSEQGDSRSPITIVPLLRGSIRFSAELSRAR